VLDTKLTAPMFVIIFLPLSMKGNDLGLEGIGGGTKSNFWLENNTFITHSFTFEYRIGKN
jgi:hypothetical protein